MYNFGSVAGLSSMSVSNELALLCSKLGTWKLIKSVKWQCHNVSNETLNLNILDMYFAMSV